MTQRVINVVLWTLSIFFVVVALTTAVVGYCYDFKPQAVLIGKTAEVRGEITEIRIRRTPHGGHFYQVVTYVYEVNGAEYLGTKQVGQKWGLRETGNGVKVRYLLRKPQQSRVIGFYERK